MRMDNRLIGVLGFLFLAGLACAQSNPAEIQSATLASSGSPALRSIPGGISRITLAYGGINRSYLLYSPRSADWSRPVALVIILHGGGGNAETALRTMGFNSVADQTGFLAVYPNGTSPQGGERLLTWNGGSCCAYAQEQNVDDAGFIRAIVQDLRSRIAVDPKRIFATGMSNGAILSHRLACEAADLVAAIGPVSGTLNFSPCLPSEPVSIIEFHGTADQNIRYEGGAGPQSITGVDFRSVEDSVGFWTSFNRCDPQPRTEMHADFRRDAYAGCANAAAVELYTILSGGHAWPGGDAGWPDADTPTGAISASEVIWEFFAAHPKP